MHGRTEVRQRRRAIRRDRVAREEANALGEKFLLQERLAAHPQHRLDAVPVAQPFERLQHVGVAHLGANRLGGFVRVAVAIDKAMLAAQIAVIGDVHHRRRIAAVLAIVAREHGADHGANVPPDTRSISISIPQIAAGSSQNLLPPTGFDKPSAKLP